MRRLFNKKGFTLMEILIVIAVIAILVTILVPTIGNSLRKAREAADVANLRAAYATYQVAAIADSVPPTFTITEDGLITVSYIGGSFTSELYYVMSGSGDTCGAVPINEAAGSVIYIPKIINDGNPYIWDFIE